jgi:hypothetical protein
MASTDPDPVEAMNDPLDDSRSILFGNADVDLSGVEEPPFFRDLNLDQVVEAIVRGRDEYELTPFFYAPLRDVDSVGYRHEVFRDLENDALRGALVAFAGEMGKMRRYLNLSEKQRYTEEKERWFLDAAADYCGGVAALAAALGDVELHSDGLRGLRAYLEEYAASDRFASLTSDVDDVRRGLDGVTYTLRIKSGRVTVTTYQDERDYSIEVEKTFERFRQGAVEDHLFKIRDSGSMDHVEARIAQLVARLYPREFGALETFCTRWRDFLDARIARFDREIQFYLAYVEHMERIEKAGLSFSLPTVSNESKEIAAEDAFDLALAGKLAPERGAVVCNDFFLHGPERIIVVTGPNQGGKTTFARMFGQLLYLAGLGVPVPGRAARLFLPDRVFTHFEREEDISTLRGKLDDELVRVRDILQQAGGDSVLVLNEIFASTTLADAVYLGAEVLQAVIGLDCLAVCVTFVDELTTIGPATVSMVAAVAPDDPSQRTFKIVRRPADGRAYASALADKYGVSYERLKKRIRR